MVIFNCMQLSCPVLLHFLVQLCNKNVIVIILAIYNCAYRMAPLLCTLLPVVVMFLL